MAKSRKLRSSRKSRSLKRGGNGCRQCTCGGEMRYMPQKSGTRPYCICKKCKQSYWIGDV